MPKLSSFEIVDEQPTTQLTDKPKSKHPGGRPTKYRPEYCQAIIEYFEVPLTKTITKTYTTKAGTKIEEAVEKANEFPTFERYAHSIGVIHETLLEWAKIFPEFTDAYARAKQLQKAHLVGNGIMDRYDGNFAKFVAINCTDMREKTEVEIKSDKPLLVVMPVLQVQGGGDREAIEVQGRELPSKGKANQKALASTNNNDESDG